MIFFGFEFKKQNKGSQVKKNAYSIPSFFMTAYHYISMFNFSPRNPHIFSRTHNSTFYVTVQQSLRVLLS